MGNFNKQIASPQAAFTRLELGVVLACVVLLGLVTLPLLGRSHSAASEAVCMNNLRNLGRALLIYSDQNRGFIPEEGNTANLVTDSANADAWYNLAVQPEYPAMTNLYTAQKYPLPGNGTIYSCPSADLPAAPSKAFAFFMYGENNFACVNKGTRASQGQSIQTRIPLVPKPSRTFLMGEVIYTTGSLFPAVSGVTPNYTATRHNGFGLFTMFDGSVRALAHSAFRHPGDSVSATAEWYVNGSLTSWPCYWWPTSTTQQ
jgi:type II secretory pathway pseudopilin PulG